MFDYVPNDSSFGIIRHLEDSLREVEAVNVIRGEINSKQVGAYVRFRWPHNFTRPISCPQMSCKFIIYIPWELGSVPISWDVLYADVDMIWAPSSFTAAMFPTKVWHKVAVVPHGVHCPETRKGLPSAKESTMHKQSYRRQFGVNAQHFTYLFIGGDLPRKGVVSLIQAWCMAFSRQDSVQLLLRLTYSHSLETVSAVLQDEVRAKAMYGIILSECATIHVFKKHVDNINMLYLASDVYINPAKAEGFALTPMEAIAAGNLVISSSKGATNQYLSSQFAFLVPSRKERCKIWPCAGRKLCVFPSEKSPGAWDACEKLHDYPTWHSIDKIALAETMWRVRQEAPALHDMSSFSRHFVCKQFSWKSVALTALHEIERISSDTPTRTLDPLVRKSLKKYDYLLTDVFDSEDLDRLFRMTM